MLPARAVLPWSEEPVPTVVGRLLGQRTPTRTTPKLQTAELGFQGARGGIRTHDLRITSALLYP